MVKKNLKNIKILKKYIKNCLKIHLVTRYAKPGKRTLSKGVKLLNPTNLILCSIHLYLMYYMPFYYFVIISLFQRSTFYFLLFSIFVILSSISLLQRSTFNCNTIDFCLGCLNCNVFSQL